MSNQLNIFKIPNISKRPVNKEKMAKTFKLLYEILKKAKTEEEFLQLKKDLLSTTEQIMIAKRIALIYLIIKKADTEGICKYLKVSRATVAKYRWLTEKKKNSKLKKIINDILKKEKILHFFEDIFADFFYTSWHQKRTLESKNRTRKKEKKRKMLDV